MVVICYASDVIEYDRRTPELSNALLHMKQDITSIEKKTLKPRLRLKLILDIDIDIDIPARNALETWHIHMISYKKDINF